ncbi:DUF4974 domain-containing protein [Chitinophaga silvatica]|uniref:DUF4974 domain-containing protein n=1 Tax=Chitinophaga silvatica TaxID=2282649 RepID=A0A3E1Y3N4_9BACT|nr:FecR domain-containing protein [Chitinophaga silvatica]RFS19300.1 DUF4974 domain-containing protein [Chitinophaga silvatica]
MDQPNFKQLIDDYLAGKLDAATASQLESWLDTLGDATAFEQLNENEKALAKAIGYNRLLHRIQSRKGKVLGINWKFLAAAAILSGMLVFSRELLNFLVPHRIITLNCGNNEKRKQLLSDGSIVWLKGNSKLIFPLTFESDKREVTIEGEGLFEIAREAERPFYVRSGKLTTKVLGTSFSIKTNGDSVAVTLLTGKVIVTGPQCNPITLLPSEQAVYTPQQSYIRQEPQDSSYVQAFIQHTEYEMAFNDANLSTILQRIEKKFEVTIQLSDPNIASNKLTADLTDQSLQQTIGMICQALNLDFNQKGKTILIKQKSGK